MRRSFLIFMLTVGLFGCAHLRSLAQRDSDQSVWHVVVQTTAGRVGVGSGVAVDGRIVTAGHVVTLGGTIRSGEIVLIGVTQDGDTFYDVTDWEVNDQRDVAVLTVQARMTNIRVARRPPEESDSVCIVEMRVPGKPVAHCGTVKISSFGRLFLDVEARPGYSGAPVVDNDGVLVGIVTHGGTGTAVATSTFHLVDPPW